MPVILSNLFEIALNNAPLLDVTETKNEIISGDLSRSQSSVSFHNFKAM
jgi:hypothetical protein